jgi:hypothetical protein
MVVNSSTKNIFQPSGRRKLLVLLPCCGGAGIFPAVQSQPITTEHTAGFVAEAGAYKVLCRLDRALSGQKL